MGVLRTMTLDLVGLTRVLGPFVAMRWMLALIVRAPQILRQGKLRPADAALGEGPFRARRGRASALLWGPRIVSSVREIWVRNVYLDGVLSIGPDDVVVDLGCNRGVFSLLALGHGPSVRVVAVEADPRWLEIFERSLELNEWQGRATVVPAFVGGTTDFQRRLHASGRSDDVPTWSEAELIERTGLTRIDFLKVDIEGSEYDLLAADSPLLALTRQLAVELHRKAGDAEAVIAMLESIGFRTHISHRAPNDLVVLARREDQEIGTGSG